MILLLLLVAAASAGAGEVGVRLETPKEALAWASQSWDFLGVSIAVRGEAQLLPPGFRRAALSVSGSGALGSWKLEGILFATGRADAFLSGSLSRSFSRGGVAVRVAAGGRGGWAALNLQPLWVGRAWALGELAGEAWTAAVQAEGPPLAATLRLAAHGAALTLGEAAALELEGAAGAWTLRAHIQLAPAREHRVTLVWEGAGGKAQVWLGLGGGGLALSQSAKGGSALFSLVWGGGPRAALEVTRAF
ncbi:MAG: hypothetical protein N2507_05160 [Candidatus Bipolaricaulota bacterium]|nr:hypothetical protein [Candidatus Bipolaricaulota bacterium]MDW8152411.1 hypothetical protein [Candidatus Bipolaricaulota bacterium]